ncbi:MAG: helix-turn-helix domain-containing protein [Halioglobus sp.]
MNYQVRQDFSSFEEFNSFNHGWDTDFSVCSNQPYQARIEQFASDEVLVNTGSFSQGTIQRGTTPPGMHTFALPVLIRGPMYWRSIPIHTQCLMAFPENHELQAVAYGPSSMCTISVHEDRISKQLAVSGEYNHNDLNKGGATELQAYQWHKLHKLLRFYSECLAQHGDSRYSKLLEEDLLDGILDLMMGSATAGIPIRPEAAARNTRRALDYMYALQREPMNIADLCSTLGISRRVLELSFKKYVGLSPKQFSNQQRMHSCHQELLRGSAQDDSVSQVAMGWGFWHMGQFGSDYKKLFGQTPGTTLAE